MALLPSDFLFKYGTPQTAATTRGADLPRAEHEGPAQKHAPVGAAMPEPLFAALRAFGSIVLKAAAGLGPDVNVHRLVDATNLDLKDLRPILDWLISQGLLEVRAADRYGNDQLGLTTSGADVATSGWPAAGSADPAATPRRGA